MEGPCLFMGRLYKVGESICLLTCFITNYKTQPPRWYSSEQVVMCVSCIHMHQLVKNIFLGRNSSVYVVHMLWKFHVSYCTYIKHICRCMLYASAWIIGNGTESEKGTKRTATLQSYFLSFSLGAPFVWENTKIRMYSAFFLTVAMLFISPA